jgi:WD40 repeat protein
VQQQPEAVCAESLCGHTQAVTCLAVAPSDDRILSGSRDGTLKLWGRCGFGGHACFDTLGDGGGGGGGDGGHTDFVSCCAFGPSGSGGGSGADFVVSGGEDWAVKVWVPGQDGWRAEHTLGEGGGGQGLGRGHSHAVTGVAASEAGGWLASCARDDTVRVWDTRAWQRREVLQCGEGGGAAAALAISGCGRFLACGGGGGGTTLVWDTRQWQLLAALPSGPVQSCAFSAGCAALSGQQGAGGWLVTCGSDGRTCVWGASSWALLHEAAGACSSGGALDCCAVLAMAAHAAGEEWECEPRASAAALAVLEPASESEFLSL